MYRPNFCVDCGERIERHKWRLWTSRRFCHLCARRFRKAAFLIPLVAGLALFTVGYGFGTRRQTAPPPLILQQAQLPRAAAPVQSQQLQTAQPNLNGNSAQASPTTSTASAKLSDSTSEPPTDPNEIVSMCGARTQKGTPCTRRVRGTGRCWQHRGKPAMLPPAKLIIS